MADKKLTEVDTSTSLADSDKLIGNIGNSVKQITLTNLVTIIKNKIGSLKNPHALTFTGAVDDTYDGSAAKTINIPTGSGGSGTTDYNDLENKPQINGVELSGNKSGNDVGLVNNQQGIANVGKVLGIGQDGLVVPVENAGASDNIIYKDVPKQLNPNITDSFQRAMWNLKLYGKSTQGADPSPTNPQEITAISQFDGNIRNSNQLFDASKLSTTSQGGATITNNGDGSFTISGSGNLTENFINYFNYSHEETLNILKTGNISLKTGATTNPNFKVQIKIADSISSATTLLQIENNQTKEITQEILNNPDIFLRLTLFGNFNSDIISGIIKPMLYQDGDGTWQPFDSNPQEFTYTPTNPMYSTQDGSIADYVDVENEVEVYNTLEQTFNGTESGWQYQEHTGVAFLHLENTPQQQPFCETMQCYKYVENSPYQDGLTINNFGVLVIKIEGMTSLQDYKYYLSTNPLKVRYGKSVVISTVPIPQERLTMLRSLHTYTGVTNLLCNAPVSFDYEQSLQIVIQNIWNAIGQTNANILLGGNQ